MSNFAIKKDNEGKTYYTGYYDKLGSAIVSLDNINIEVIGTPKINIREGNSKFGEQLFIELLRDGAITNRKTVKKSEYDTVEIYFPRVTGLKFFKDFIKYYENNKGSDNY